MSKLTDRQADVLRMVAGYLDVHGRPPTVREIGDALGIGSTNGVSDHLKALVRKGYLARSDRARGLRVLREAEPSPGRTYLRAALGRAIDDVRRAAAACRVPREECEACTTRRMDLSALAALADRLGEVVG